MCCNWHLTIVCISGSVFVLSHWPTLLMAKRDSLRGYYDLIMTLLIFQGLRGERVGECWVLVCSIVSLFVWDFGAQLANAGMTVQCSTYDLYRAQGINIETMVPHSKNLSHRVTHETIFISIFAFNDHWIIFLFLGKYSSELITWHICSLPTSKISQQVCMKAVHYQLLYCKKKVKTARFCKS